MCGIFGYIGDKNAASVCMNGLKKLEYRGYDSAGIGGVKDGEIVIYKEIGKISSLEELLKSSGVQLEAAISHTRWATHGKPSKENAHPHFDQKKTVAVVHNGVIENYARLREALTQNNQIVFHSETDTEVIAQVIATTYQGDFLEACKKAFAQLEGSFAAVIIQKDHPGMMVAVAEKSPLVVGYAETTEEIFVASDSNALAGYELDIFFLRDGEFALLEKNHAPMFFDRKGHSIVKQSTHQRLEESEISRGQFEHFMLKEICEQTKTIRDAMINRFNESDNSAQFDELSAEAELKLSQIEHIVLVACGTSYHAGFVAAYFLESIAGISARAEIASEFRYRDPVILPKTLVIALSQSGETADTIAAFRNVKEKCYTSIALCNIAGSTLSREADNTIFLHSGPEIAVASTKTFTSQITVLYLLTLYLARLRKSDKQQAHLFFKYLYELPEQVAQILNDLKPIRILARKYSHFNDFFFLGRGILYPTALEAALKLKEIAYINATGYPAGEMKHGPIALLTKDVPVLIFCANSKLQQKLMSNLMESKARGSPIIVFGWRDFEAEILPVADDVVWVPKCSDELACVLLTVVSQLFAYFMALERGTDIDQPRNLAKSVTVE